MAPVSTSRVSSLSIGEYLIQRLQEYVFNDVHSWHYEQLPAVLGGGTGYEI